MTAEKFELVITNNARQTREVLMVDTFDECYQTLRDCIETDGAMFDEEGNAWRNNECVHLHINRDDYANIGDLSYRITPL